MGPIVSILYDKSRRQSIDSPTIAEKPRRPDLRAWPATARPGGSLQEEIPPTPFRKAWKILHTFGRRNLYADSRRTFVKVSLSVSGLSACLYNHHEHNQSYSPQHQHLPQFPLPIVEPRGTFDNSIYDTFYGHGSCPTPKGFVFPIRLTILHDGSIGSQ